MFVRTKKGKEKGLVHLIRLAFIAVIGNAILLSLHVCEWVCVWYMRVMSVWGVWLCAAVNTHMEVKAGHQASSSASLH